MAEYTVQQVMQASLVVPVLVIDNAEDAVPLANALVAGGIKVLEITLRTPAALPAVEAIAGQVSDAIVGVGTVSSAAQLQDSIDSGAQFAISPGVTPQLLEAAGSSRIPFLPGIATVSELMLGIEAGLKHFKFFPATAAGGVPVLKAFAGPFPDVVFCPTGGIGENNFLEFLSLPNVLCVGGSWVAPAGLIRAKDWPAITQLARKAADSANQLLSVQ